MDHQMTEPSEQYYTDADEPHHYSPSMVPKSEHQLVLLGTSQAKEGGAIACPTVALYMCLYLLYSETPKKDSLADNIRHACRDFTRANVTRFENIHEPYNRYKNVHGMMTCDGDVNGLMLTREALVNLSTRIQKATATFPGTDNESIKARTAAIAKIVPPVFLEPDAPIYWSVKEFLEALVAKVRPLDPLRARAVSFTRSGATFAVCCRKLRDGHTLRFDIVDSHAKVELQACWVSCYTVEDAVICIENLYPPTDKVSDLPVDPKTLEEEDDARKEAKEADPNYKPRVGIVGKYEPEALFSVTFFAPVYDTYQEAEAHGRREQQSADTIAQNQFRHAIERRRVSFVAVKAE